jgi:transcriptional regulator with XRE-family HTH domain
MRAVQPEVAQELLRMGSEAYEWRRQAGLTQRALEALTGIDQTTISKLERGRLPGLRLHHLARIRLACRTGKHVDSTYGRHQPTRPLMTPESSQVDGPVAAAAAAREARRTQEAGAEIAK